MSTTPEPACLVIADIAGYTTYLAGVELDHAQDILADLIGTVVGALQPSFSLAKLEGDAAFAWAPGSALDGSALQDAIEGTFFAFRRRLRDIHQASRCECNACIRMPDLDLKFVVHHGTVAHQQMAGLDELIGRDVILVHRLLKNGVEAATGFHAYALYTEACVAAMGVEPVAQGLVAHREEIDVIGAVDGWVRDLDAAWRAEQERARVIVDPATAQWAHAFDVRAPRELVWEYVTSPRLRPTWSPTPLTIREAAVAGRRGPGTVNHCVHGDAAILEEVLDWRPYDYWTTRSTLQMPGEPRTTMTDVFVATPDGTHVETRIGPPEPGSEELFAAIMPALERDVRASIERLIVLVTAEAERRAGARPPEPSLPPTTGRHLREPIRTAPSSRAPGAASGEAPPDS